MGIGQIWEVNDMTFDIDPALKHCQQEVDDALRLGDTEKVKALVIQARLPWIDPVLVEKDTSCSVH